MKVALVVVSLAAVGLGACLGSGAARVDAVVPSPAAALGFDQLFAPGERTLVPSARLRALHGARVRMTGFMAAMENPPVGSFYLTPGPVRCDESGGGTADLPPATVRVVVPSAAGRPVPFVPGPLEVTGVLRLGPQEDGRGRLFHLHLLLDAPSPTKRGANHAS